MILVDISLSENHISRVYITGHAQIFPLDEVAHSRMATLANKFLKKKKSTMDAMGSVPCAAVSVLAKSFIESLALYASQKKQALDDFMLVSAPEEGVLEVVLKKPNSSPMHVHRFAIEQMLIIGLQAVAKEYQNEIQLKIKHI